MSQTTKTHCVIWVWGCENVPFSNHWPFGVKKIGSTVLRWKSWKPFSRKWAKGDANGPIRMPKAYKNLLSHYVFGLWEFSLLLLLAFWGNKIWLPCEKVKNWKMSGGKGLKGMQMVQHKCQKHQKPTLSFRFWVVRSLPFPIIGPLG